MDSYPDLPTERDSAPQLEDGRQTERDGNGTAHSRTLWSAPKRTLPLKHSWLTTAQRDALLAFYAAHRTAAFTYSHPVLTGGATLTAIFGQIPPKERYVTHDCWDVAVQLLER